MPKPNAKNAAQSESPATADDARVAAQLITSTNKGMPNKEVSTAAIDIFSNDKMQTKLRGMAAPLGALGVDVKEGLTAADEGAVLLGTLQRLENSLGRVRQRIVQINKKLTTLQTSLVRTGKSAAPNSDLGKGLAGLTGLRATRVATAKAKGTKTKNKKQKAPKA